MADAVFSAVVGDMVSRVISLVAGHFNDQKSTESKLRKICHMLIKIHSVVEEAKGRQITNHATLEWLSELIGGTYQGRYLLDTVRCAGHELEDEHGDKVGAAQPFSLSLINPAKRMRVAACTVKSLLSRREVGSDDIDTVLESLEIISGDLREFLMLLKGYKKIRRPLATNIFVDDGQMFGRHVEKERIINFLLHDDGRQSDGELGVLQVVGDMGVGKTTLVQHACDDARVRSRFPIIMLFNFSCTYSVSMSEATVVLRCKHKLVAGDGESLNEPLHVLKENYRSKRFLLVFEDVDLCKKQTLEELLPSLRHGKQGSKIIVTTDDRRVAAGIGTAEPVSLKVLPHPEYWFFFKAHAFAGTDVEENPTLVAAGRAIARKLNGSFFGAKIVGGVLKAHPNPRFWCKVLRSNIGGLSLLGDGIEYIADLAENFLPGCAEMRRVTLSKTPFSSQTELARLQDLCLPSPDAAPRDCLADHAGSAKVLLCRSVLPFHCLYYTADCCVRGANSSPERNVEFWVKLAQNQVGLALLAPRKRDGRK